MNRWLWFVPALLLIGLLSFNLTADAQGKKKGGENGKKKNGEDKSKDKDKGKKPAEGTLKWSAFDKKGNTFYQTMTTTTKQTMKVMNQEVIQEQKQTFYFKWTSEGKSADKYTVKQKIIGLKMDIDIGGNKISYVSYAKDIPKNPMTNFFNVLNGAEFTLVIDADKLEVVEVKGVDTLVGKLSEVNQSMKPLLKKILSEDSIKQMANPVFGFIPDKGVIPESKEWTNKSKLNLGPIGTYNTTNTYNLKSEKDGIYTIGVKTDISYSAPQGEEAGGLPFKIVEAKLSSKNSTGEIVFNSAKGRIESSKMTVNLEGDLTVDIANMNTTVNLVQTQTTEMATSDDEPKELKKK